MAYKGAFNPDALPAHVEPNQAAQLIGQHQSQSPAPPSSEPSWKNKPPPPLPEKQIQPRQSHSVSPHMDNAGPRRPSAPPSSGSYNSYQQQNAPPIPGAYPGRPYSNSVTNAPRPTPPPAPTPGPGPAGTSAGVPQAGADPGLFPLFRAVDSRGTGQLTEEELGKALKNGDYTSFDPETVRLMIKMFDHDRSGTVGFEEFCGLWGFLGAWRQLFDRFDEDRSGYISLDEYTKALVAFGYHLTPPFVSHMYNLYDRRRTGAMTFDLFVQSCISLKRMTDVFKRYDTDRDGFITMSFEEFLTEILNQR